VPGWLAGALVSSLVARQLTGVEAAALLPPGTPLQPVALSSPGVLADVPDVVRGAWSGTRHAAHGAHARKADHATADPFAPLRAAREDGLRRAGPGVAFARGGDGQLRRVVAARGGACAHGRRA
jgi:hypothetical protein